MEILPLLAVALFLLLLLYFGRRRKPGGLDAYYDVSHGERHLHRWGYTDTRIEFDGPRSVRMTGGRYMLAGYSMPHLVPFAEDVLGVPFTPDELIAEVPRQPLPEPRTNQAFLAAVSERLQPDRIDAGEEARLTHSHGQLSVDEVYRLQYIGGLKRTVDLVLHPQSEEEVADILRLAREHGVCLVPYGGGTNVSGALALPPEEERMIVSVDMRRMNRVLWVDPENLQACVECGIYGKDLERELAARGFTSGHDPDSLELSTLGGWISTNASGMKKNKYGNIEEIVLEATLVTPTGEIETRHPTPRNSTGIQPRVFLFGSEGNFGVITKAVIKIHPLPEVRRYGLLVFPRFEKGVSFLWELRRTGVMPASIRLVSNFELRFSQALKPAPGFWKGIADRLQKFVLLKIKKFDPAAMSACTVVMEGNRTEVAHQRRVIYATAARFGALDGGERNGQRGYMLTFGIAYLRDFFNQFNIVAETFETSVPWSRVHDVIGAVGDELSKQCAARGVAGTPYLAYRVTQTYHTGVCIYFTMGFSGKGLEAPDEVFHEIEVRLRQAILDNGGSLSHHHGIGKIRQGFVAGIQSPNSIEVLRRTKQAIDPGNVFGIRNNVFDGS